jgi:hypothetical protein
MSNIVSLNSNRDNMLGLYNQGYGAASFDTHMSPLYYAPTPHDRIQSDKMAIYRGDTWEFLGAVSRKYNLVTHREMIDNQRAILERSNLDCSNIEERITVGSNGSKCFVHHTLPAHKVTTPDGDTAVLTFLGTNSYDGTFSFLLSGGARQGACMNGQVWTKDAATIYKAKHSKSLNINHAARVVGSALDVLSEQNNIWHKLANTECTDYAARNWILKVLNIKMNLEEFEAHCFKTGKSNKNYLYLVEAWIKYRYRLRSSSKWALYNAFTDWSTHAPAARKSTDISNLQRKREEAVQNIVTALAA